MQMSNKSVNRPVLTGRNLLDSLRQHCLGRKTVKNLLISVYQKIASERCFNFRGNTAQHENTSEMIFTRYSLAHSLNETVTLTSHQQIHIT